ncbi:MAG: DsbA family protein [Pseudomonadota bacterium]|nr:DsbA family protein [Pseudomonadota bacterium]
MKFVKNLAAVGTLALLTGVANAAHCFSDHAGSSSTKPGAPATAEPAAPSDGVFTPEQNSAIEQQVKQYLDNNPKSVVDALVAYRQQEVKRIEENAQNAITKNAPEILTNTNAPTLGNPNGNIVLVEFLDYQCGHCKKMSTTVSNLINKNKNLKVLVKELPILGDASTYAAKVALAANQQGKFYQVHSAFLNTTEKLTNETVENIAKQQGVDWNLIQVSLQSSQLEKELDKVFNIAQQLNIMGTPAFIITDLSGKNNRYFSGAASQELMQETINNISQSK